MPPVSRRALLEGVAATLGLTLVGCSSKTDTPTGPPLARIEGGKIVLEGAKVPARGEALAFLFPGGEPGVLFQNGANLTALNAICTHSGCTVEWSGNGEQPLRCPCHNSLFRADGHVVSGPAREPLKKFSVVIEGENLFLAPVG